MSDPILLTDACRELLEDLSRSRHPTARRPVWDGNGKGEPEEESGSPLPAIDLLVG